MRRAEDIVQAKVENTSVRIARKVENPAMQDNTATRVEHPSNQAGTRSGYSNVQIATKPENSYRQVDAQVERSTVQDDCLGRGNANADVTVRRSPAGSASSEEPPSYRLVVGYTVDRQTGTVRSTDQQAPRCKLVYKV